jgi:uncharacterized membrane protein
METNGIIIAQIMGPALVIVGASMLLNSKNFYKVIEDVTHNASSIFIISLIRLIMGMIIFTLTTRSTFADGLMKTLGLVIICAAILGFTHPDYLIKNAKVFIKDKGTIQILLAIILILGSGLTYVGYMF